MANMTLLEHYEIFERNLVLFAKQFIKMVEEKGLRVGFSTQETCDYRISMKTLFHERYSEEFVGDLFELHSNFKSTSLYRNQLLVFQIVSNAKPIDKFTPSLTIIAVLDISRLERITLTIAETHPSFASKPEYKEENYHLENWQDVLNRQVKHLSSKL